MRSFVECDAHRRYSVFVSVDENEKASKPTRVEHEGATLTEYLASLPTEADVAVEATPYDFRESGLRTLRAPGVLPLMFQ